VCVYAVGKKSRQKGDSGDERAEMTDADVSEPRGRTGDEL